MVLLRPVIQAYELVIQHAVQLPIGATNGGQILATDPVSLVRAHPATYLLHLEDAFRSLTERGMLHEVQPGRYAPANAP
jgi:hypothetical protein